MDTGLVEEVTPEHPNSFLCVGDIKLWHGFLTGDEKCEQKLTKNRELFNPSGNFVALCCLRAQVARGCGVNDGGVSNEFFLD